MKMTFRVVFIGALVVFFAVVTVAVFTPVALWRPAETLVAHPYTPVQELGRKLFYSNGCNYCHTQYVRDVDNGMGQTSLGGDYAFDQPMTLGSERTGPDLSYIGRKRSMQWEIDHLRHPREYSPMSIMPEFTFLSDSQARAIGEYLFYLGDRNAAEFMILSPPAYADSAPPKEGKVMPATGENPAAIGWPTFKESGLYNGKKIYVGHCMTCHGCAGNGLGTYGGTLIVTPVNFKADPFRTMSDDEWFWHVSEGIQGTVMPPWKESLTEKERWEVIKYVQAVYSQTFERDPDEGDLPAEYDLTNPLPITIDNIDAGKRIWTRECAVCHGDAAHGEGIYRQGIEPVPPSFDPPSGYSDFTDGDWFWRISESVPWTAMPAWKVLYNETERWQLVTYIKTMFVQQITAPPQPPDTERFVATPVELNSTIPPGTSYDAGKQQFLIQCSHCHGLAGDGKGWAGAYLNPKPAALQVKLGPDTLNTVKKWDGTQFAKVTHGIRDSAMPIWGEFLAQRHRWLDVKYLKGSFAEGKKVNQSVYGDGKVPYGFVRADTGIFQDEIEAIDPAAGKPVYEQFCATCHGADGKGNGPGTTALASGGPAAFPADMNLPYLFWRVRAGVSDSMMYGFEPLLTESEIWNVTAYVVNLAGGKFGG